MAEDIRIRQADIFKNITHVEHWNEEGDKLNITNIIYPYIIVLSQDCDLQQDKKVRSVSIDDKALVSVLVAPLYNFEQFVNGEHLDTLGITIEEKIYKKANGTPRRNLEHNETPRFHYIKFPKDVQMADAVVDFKHYFTVNATYLERMIKTNRVCCLPPVFRERISQRFANFLSRIGLPTPHPEKISI